MIADMSKGKEMEGLGVHMALDMMILVSAKITLRADT